MTEPREVTDQLDLFRQPAAPIERCDGCGRPTEECCVGAGCDSSPEVTRAYQLTELPGETFEDIFTGEAPQDRLRLR